MIQKRPVVLLEVLIAFALVALCLLPMLYPHVAILKAEKEFVTTVELDHAVNVLFAHQLQKLYLNEIAWADIEGGKAIPLEGLKSSEYGLHGELPFTGTYRFEEVRHKPPEPEDKGIYLFKLIYAFVPKKGYFQFQSDKVFTYEYQVMIERRLK